VEVSVPVDDPGGLSPANRAPMKTHRGGSEGVEAGLCWLLSTGLTTARVTFPNHERGHLHGVVHAHGLFSTITLTITSV